MQELEEEEEERGEGGGEKRETALVSVVDICGETGRGGKEMMF